MEQVKSINVHAQNLKEMIRMQVPLIKCHRRGYLLEYDKVPEHIKYLLKEYFAKIDDRDNLEKQFGTFERMIG
jgi:hypothetical protein